MRFLNSIEPSRGNVAYWMSRDQRVDYNHALLYAQELALEYKSPLYVVFNIVPKFLNATIRQYDFMLKGLKYVSENLEELNIPFIILLGDPTSNIVSFIRNYSIKVLITDFDPLRIKRHWKKKIIEQLDIPVIEVDTHNIVPAFFVSNKKEYNAFSLRKKIIKYLKEFLIRSEKIIPHPFNERIVNKIEPSKIEEFLKINREVKPVERINPGTEEARKTLNKFIIERLNMYHLKRNDPNFECQSDLSPYLHFGQISSLEVVLEVLNSNCIQEAKDAFLEEIIVRKELADNFCLYESNYDNINGIPLWARKTLEEHKKDKREFIYRIEDLEYGRTHDLLWNAAQKQMVVEGKMHGYLRMYWAKKILEWTSTPEEAIETAIYLNDKYELDGRDPNGYVGILWSIGGLHDRPWKERKIFGKIRYMNYEGCKRRFNVEKFIERYDISL